MERGRSAERVRQEVIRLSHSGLDSRTFGIEAVKQLRKAIPTDVSFFATADPATLLFTSAVRDEVLAQATPQFLEREFLKDDPVKFARLARGRSPVDSLGMATKGELARSERYREMLAPMDLGDELRAALVAGSKCWGFMCLHRERSGPDFTPAEATFLARLVPHLAEGLRKALLLGGSGATSPRPDGPGLVLLADDLSLVAITPTAVAWLAEVPDSARPRSPRSCTSRPTPCGITSSRSSTRWGCAAEESSLGRSSPSTTSRAWRAAKNRTPMDGSPEPELQCGLNRLASSIASGSSCPGRFETHS